MGQPNYRSGGTVRHRIGAVSLSVLALVLGQSAAFAAPGTDLDEIVITAEKRQSTLQDTPISITAVSGDDLARQGISNVADLASGTPGVSVASVGPGRSNFDIRGLSNAGGSSATVGFYLDEVPVTPPTSALSAAGKTEIDPDLYDLARVEVLRGPQGTLYGASSMGGTIRLITNQPKLDKFEASGESILSGTDGVNYTQNAMVNVPLVGNKLAVRISGTEKYESGFIDRVVVNNFPAYTGSSQQFRGDLLSAPAAKTYHDVNDDLIQGVRGVVLWKPTDRLSVTGTIYAQKIMQGGQNSYDMPPGTLAHYQPADVAEKFEQDFSLYSLTAKYEFDDFSVQSTTSELHGHMFNQEDTQEQWYPLTQGFASAPFFPTPGAGEEDHFQRQLTEELRVTSSGSGPLQWIAGGFFSDFTDKLHYSETDSGLTGLYGSPIVFTDSEPDHLKQEALFGEVTYAVLPTLKANVGLRYYHYSFDFQQHLAGITAGPPFDFAGSAGDSGFNPKFNIDYTPTDSLTLFATAAKGFRPGGPNLPVPVSYCGGALAALGLNAAPTAYQPDTVWSYELGEKAKLFDGKLAVRGSAYYIDWAQIQQQIQLSCGYNFNANAGSASSKGGELELDARLFEGLTLHQTLGYTQASITSAAPGYGSILPVGQQLQDVPRWTFSTGLDYDRPLDDVWDLSVHVLDRFVDTVNDFSAEPYPLATRLAYNLVDARIGLDSDKISAYLFAANLFDRRAILGFDHSEAQNTPQFARLIPNRPRTIGLDLQYRL